jgi:hypothetical protein
MWKNIAERVRQQMTIWRMRMVCWITKAADTHSEYVIPITIPRQEWLCEAPHCYVMCTLLVLLLSPDILLTV